MATNLSGRVWTLDAADVGALPRTLIGAQNRRVIDGQPQTVTQGVAVGQVSWSATDSVADDVVVFTDLAGNEVIRLAPAPGADFGDQKKGVDTVFYQGLVLTSLPHGIVTLEIR
jgi:hypothetical protein